MALVKNANTGNLIKIGAQLAGKAVPVFGSFDGVSAVGINCQRASAGDAIGGGASASFAANVLRIIGGKLFKDAGGTNIVPDPADFSVAGWTKTNLGTPS